MTYYLRWRMSELPSQVGTDEETGFRVIRYVEGCASYGPYCRLEAGTYFGGFRIRALETSDATDILRVQAGRMMGTDILANRSVSGPELFTSVAGLVGIDFVLENESTNVEICLYVSEAASIEVQSLIVFRNELA
ncbi:hypothetical protein GCM10007887_38700 [Methylobacterium haplocladii]|uniref:Uncharacterized protein n=1 Tax=Methylobacterium haplocladii TaxID=1176176 RepID=A0A512IW32_9HYPH|nr:hypothetical protein MHA02_42600 [Methylobacterium haplocladii]GLS61173.1 hypothetical protein GCM10007887_38700 [Methylobacterium haplocladii]